MHLKCRNDRREGVTALHEHLIGQVTYSMTVSHGMISTNG
jgi:hypothetical protein